MFLFSFLFIWLLFLLLGLFKYLRSMACLFTFRKTIIERWLRAQIMGLGFSIGRLPLQFNVKKQRISSSTVECLNAQREWHFSRTLVKPCSSDWDLNPQSETQAWKKKKKNGNWIHRILTEITLLVSWGSGSWCLITKNSVSNVVIGKKWIYLERYTLHR